MVVRKCNAVVFEAECGEHIDNFAKDIVKIKENSSDNIIAVFQRIPMILEVHKTVTEAEIKEYMLRRIRAISDFSAKEFFDNGRTKNKID